MPDSSSVQVASAAAVRTSASDFENATYQKVTRRLLPFLVLCYVVSYLDRINVGFAKLQMLGDLGFSETVFGLGAGIFFIGYFFSRFPATSSCIAWELACGSRESWSPGDWCPRRRYW